jgi:hypothetical protein
LVVVLLHVIGYNLELRGIRETANVKGQAILELRDRDLQLAVSPTTPVTRMSLIKATTVLMSSRQA